MSSSVVLEQPPSIGWLGWNNGRGWPPRPGEVSWLYNENADHMLMIDKDGVVIHDGPMPKVDV